LTSDTNVFYRRSEKLAPLIDEGHLPLANSAAASILRPLRTRDRYRYGRPWSFSRARPIWPDSTSRRMVDSTRGGVRGPPILRRLRHLGCVSGQSLYFWTLSLALLAAGAVGRLTAQPFRPEANVVARVVAVFTGAGDSGRPRDLPADLLLLP